MISCLAVDVKRLAVVVGYAGQIQKYCVITLCYAFPQGYSRVGHSPLSLYINY